MHATAVTIREKVRTEPVAHRPARRLPATPFVVALLIVIFLFGLTRYRLRNMPLERDEGEYAFIGQLMLQGIPPFKLAYTMKLPGTAVAYAAIMAVFGDTPAGIHLGLALVNGITSLLLFVLATRLFGKLVGIVAGATYVVFSTSYTVQGFEAHATHFVVLAAILSMLFLLYGLESRKAWLFLASGLFGGLAFLMKQHGAFLALFCFLYLVGSAWRRQFGARNTLKCAALFAFAAALPYAVMCWILHRAGVFGQFWFWTVTYAEQYSKNGFREIFNSFSEGITRVTEATTLLWILAGLGIPALLWNRATRQHAWFLLGLLLFSLLAISPGAYFRPHYFVMLLPPVAMLVGVAISVATDFFASHRRTRYLIALPTIIFLISFGIAIFLQHRFYTLSPERAVQITYGDTMSAPFLAAQTVGEYVRANSSPQALVAVLGSDPEIYFYAHRRSATGYMYMYGLREKQKYAAFMQQQMIHETESNHPEYLVYLDVVNSWESRDPVPPDPGLLSWVKNYMQDHYERVGVADLGESIQYVWGDAAKSYLPHSDKVIYVFKRKS